MSDCSNNVEPATPEEDFFDLFENAPCGYLTMKPDGRIIRVNTVLATWTGYTAEQLNGKQFRDILTFGTRIFFETNLAPQLLLHGRCDEMSLDLRTATGAAIAVSASALVRINEDRQQLLIRVAFFKATERRRYERQLVEAYARIQRQERDIQGLLDAERSTSELREQFIAVLGHDLRNPLAAMASGLRMLQDRMLVKHHSSIVEILESTIARMAGLIDNVMDFARGRLGAGIPLDLRSDVALTPVLEQVVSELKIGLAGRVIVADFNLSSLIKCDPSRIGQLVSNLLANALTHGAPAEPVYIHAEENGGMLTIWVANSGDPILPAAVERLFQPFFRGEVKASQQGLGLGLHIASEIAKAHAGTLTVTSTLKKTCFTFRMPTTAER